MKILELFPSLDLPLIHIRRIQIVFSLIGMHLSAVLRLYCPLNHNHSITSCHAIFLESYLQYTRKQKEDYYLIPEYSTTKIVEEQCTMLSTVLK